MRIHSNTLSTDSIFRALTEAKEAGTVASTVQFKILTRHKSQSRVYGFEVQLESLGKADGDGRRVGQNGSYGAMHGDMYAATYDEWGFFLAKLYELDEDLTIKYYPTKRDFDIHTGLTYSPQILAEKLARGYSDPFPYVNGKNTIGRRGYGRLPFNHPAAQHGYAKYQPRTAAEVLALAHL